MNRFLRSLVVPLAAVALVVAATQRVDALGPSVLMFYGGTLPAPFYISGAEANSFGDLLTPAKLSANELVGRAYFKVAVFWGPQSDPALRGITKLADLRPEMAWQHGKYY